MESFSVELLIAAHKHSSRHKDEILKSNICGCFYCLRTFSPTEVEDWVDDTVDIRNLPELQESCALCPKCAIDSVIGSSSGYPVTDLDFLKAMNKYWF